MYVGHVGIALGLRRVRGGPPLWLLVVAAQAPDWGDALIELYGAKAPDPGWSPHGFPLVGLSALAAALVGARLTRSARGAGLAAMAVLSHWAADYVTGSKPTWPGGPMVGLGWFLHPARDLAVEAAMTVVGWWLWRASLPEAAGPVRRRRLRRHWGMDWALLALLLGLQLGVDLVMARRLGILR